MTGRELYAVTFAILLFGAGMIALTWIVGPSVAPIQLPSYVWSAIGFCILGLLLVALQRVVTPSPYGTRLPARDAILGVLAGSILYAGAMHMLL
ncbi:MAG TPA: hypothetical protein VHY33_07910 [Thermoanaerobaculia bacterium]|nr:hypothetical protein [Thermoanaerobaculia bacterium]